MVQYLHEKGVDLHTGDDAALRSSARNGHVSLVQYLLQNHANVHAKNDRALQISALNGHMAVVQCLVQYGADLHLGIEAAKDQPKVLAWLEDYQRMQQEQTLLSQELMPFPISKKAKRL